MSGHDRAVELAVVILHSDGSIQPVFESLLNPDQAVGPTHVHGVNAGDVKAAPRSTRLPVALLRASLDASLWQVTR